MPSNVEDRSSIEFQQYWRILKKRWNVATAVILTVFGATVCVTFLKKPIYEAEGKLLFNKTNRVSSLTSLSTQVGELSGVTQTSSPVDTEAEVIRSNPIAQKTIDSLKLKNKQGEPLEIEELLKKLKVKSVRGTDVLMLQYRSTNPQEAAGVVNTVIGYYLENNVRINRAQATAAQDFLRKQLPEVESRVVQAEVVLRRFKEANKVVSLEEEAKRGVESLKDLSAQITKTDADLADTNSRTVELQNQLELETKQAVNLNSISQSVGVQQVLTEYRKVQDELAVQRRRLTEQNPAIQSLVSKEAALAQQLKLRIGETIGTQESVTGQNLQTGSLKQNLTEYLVKSEVEKLALVQRSQVLKSAYSNYQNRLSVLPELEQKQQQLERQLQVARSTYEQLLKRLQEVDVEVNQNVGNARVVSEALVPKKAVSPKKLINLALGGILGTLLSVGTVLILEALDKSLKTAQEAQQMLGYPLLGTIPRLGIKSSLPQRGADLPVRDNPYSPFNAAFEMLQANLDFTISDQGLKVIMVVSATPDEGKSFVAANLAVANAHMGRRVLLIDADMRQPRQQDIWELPQQMGLSNVLVNQVELTTATHEVLINLDVLITGTKPPNAAGLLDSQRMAALITDATRNYDFVIIDTPPLNLFADALILSKLVDGMVLVVCPAVLDAAVAEKTKTTLEQSRSRVLGMVINDTTVKKSSGRYYDDQDGKTTVANNSEVNNGKFRVF